MTRFSDSNNILIAPGPALARPGDPLVLPNGTILEEEKPYRERSSNSKSDRSDIIIPAHSYRANQRRNLKDFPANEQMFKALSVVFAMTLYGISNVEICDSLNISLDQLTELRSHHGYAELFNNVLAEFINANSDMLQSRIAAYSHAAVGRVGSLINGAEREETQLAASKDMLDRAGLRPQDLAASQQASQNELQIRITRKTDDVIVDVKINGATNGQNEEG